MFPWAKFNYQAKTWSNHLVIIANFAYIDRILANEFVIEIVIGEQTTVRLYKNYDRTMSLL